MRFAVDLDPIAAIACAQDTGPIQQKSKQLEAKLRDAKMPAETRADIEVFLKAAQWILRFPEEFYKPDYFASAQKVLDIGLDRAGHE